MDDEEKEATFEKVAEEEAALWEAFIEGDVKRERNYFNHIGVIYMVVLWGYVTVVSLFIEVVLINMQEVLGFFLQVFLAGVIINLELKVASGYRSCPECGMEFKKWKAADNHSKYVHGITYIGNENTCIKVDIGIKTRGSLLKKGLDGYSKILKEKWNEDIIDEKNTDEN